MLFNDILKKTELELDPEFKRLFQLALKNQSHNGDLLLLAINGNHEKFIDDVNKTIKKYCPYVIGPGKAGRSDTAHYNFIHKYRTQVLTTTPFDEYLKQVEWDATREAEINTLVDNEEMSIQLEMLVYLKIWEGDLFIKNLYELVRILKGDCYDWHFKIKESKRDSEGIASRDILIRQLIREEIRPFSEVIYNCIKESYRTQLRNAIAHSNYAFLGRRIHLFNDIEGDPSHQLRCLHFNVWISMFHNTMMLYNYMTWLKNTVKEHYSQLAIMGNGCNEIRITKADGAYEYRLVEYIHEMNRWKWKV